tara:strand:+ start:19843 stop:20427 length:585 start_codon:yes stop_codon:yes gene_type:complete
MKTRPREYHFVDALTDIRSAVLLIGLHGPNLVGMELGVFRAESHLTILQNCPNVKKLYGVDNWRPYTDWMNPNGDGPLNSTTEAQMETHEWIAKHHIKWSGVADRSELWKGNTSELHEEVDNNSFDFIFFDAWLDYEQVKRELTDWYPKLKKGGLCIGHDYNAEAVNVGVAEFRDINDINKHMATYDSMFAWRK